MYTAIHANPMSSRPSANLHHLLHHIHSYKKQRAASTLISELYQPILWRSFNVSVNICALQWIRKKVKGDIQHYIFVCWNLFHSSTKSEWASFIGIKFYLISIKERNLIHLFCCWARLKVFTFCFKVTGGASCLQLMLWFNSLAAVMSGIHCRVSSTSV